MGTSALRRSQSPSCTPVRLLRVGPVPQGPLRGCSRFAPVSCRGLLPLAVIAPLWSNSGLYTQRSRHQEVYLPSAPSVADGQTRVYPVGRRTQVVFAPTLASRPREVSGAPIPRMP